MGLPLVTRQVSNLLVVHFIGRLSGKLTTPEKLANFIDHLTSAWRYYILIASSLLETHYVGLQLVLSVATAEMAAQNSNSTLLLPSTTHVISVADSQERAAFTAMSTMKEEPMDVDAGYDTNTSSSIDVMSLLLFCQFSSLLLLRRTLLLTPQKFRNFVNFVTVKSADRGPHSRNFPETFS